MLLLVIDYIMHNHWEDDTDKNKSHEKHTHAAEEGEEIIERKT